MRCTTTTCPGSPLALGAAGKRRRPFRPPVLLQQFRSCLALFFQRSGPVHQFVVALRRRLRRVGLVLVPLAARSRSGGPRLRRGGAGTLMGAAVAANLLLLQVLLLGPARRPDCVAAEPALCRVAGPSVWRWRSSVGRSRAAPSPAVVILGAVLAAFTTGLCQREPHRPQRPRPGARVGGPGGRRPPARRPAHRHQQVRAAVVCGPGRLDPGRARPRPRRRGEVSPRPAHLQRGPGAAGWRPVSADGGFQLDFRDQPARRLRAGAGRRATFRRAPGADQPVVPDQPFRPRRIKPPCLRPPRPPPGATTGSPP